VIDDYAQMRTLIDKERRTKYEITKILPVLIEADNQLLLPLSEADRKLTLSAVEKYLEVETF